jgi:hypothetical protein
VFCIICFPAFTQQNDDSNEIFIISSIDFNIDGRTRVFALINRGEFIVGEELIGIKNLEQYIQDKTQLLLNERVLDTVSIEYYLGSVQEDGKIPVDLVVNVKDTWNIIAIPQPKYSSNTGFELILKARDYNFFGTMHPLRIDFGYRNDENGKTFYNLLLETDFPFELFNLNWNLSFENFFDYRPDLDLPYYYKNTTGLSVNIPFGPTRITIGFIESVIVNEEGAFGRKPTGEYQEGLYMSSNPYISWRIPTGIRFGYYGNLVYTPRISAAFNHQLPAWSLKETLQKPSMSFGHTLGFGRINWIGNFQRGFSINLSNTYHYDFNDIKNQDPLRINYRIRGIGHIAIDDIFGISTRLMFRQWFHYNKDEGYEYAGDALRGILDKDIRADIMLSLNLSVSMKILKFYPSEWFDTSKLKIFNFDLHLCPFLDTAIYRSPINEVKYSGTDFSHKNILASGGIEIIVFPASFRSLFLRASLGFNLSTLVGINPREIYIGTELHF